MSTLEEKNRKKSKRSFIPKLPSFRRKKNTSPESTPSKSSTKLKKQKNENTSNTKISVSITKETQTPQEDPKYRDKSSCQDVKPFPSHLTSHKEEEEEEQNGNSCGNSVLPFPNINTSLDITRAATSYTNPGYEGNIWQMENQNKAKICGNEEPQSEINANINQKPLKSLCSNVPANPAEFCQDVTRCSSTTSTLSSGSSLSLSSPGSVTKLVGSPKPYKSIFDDDRRGIKRQGSTPSDVDIASSCISVGSVSSLSPSREDIATKVTVRSVSTPGLQQYPVVAPVESLSPGVSPKHSHDNSKLEGAYTYDSSGGESQDNTNTKQERLEHPADHVMCSIVNLNFDLKAAVAASPELNKNIGHVRHQSTTCKMRHSVEGNTHGLVTEQQEGRWSTQAVQAEALISPSSAAVPSKVPTNNNLELESNCEATTLATEAHVYNASHSVTPQLLASDSTSRYKTQNANVAAAAAECDQKKNEVVLTRVTSVTSPKPAKAQRIPFSTQHPIAQRIQLTAMRNKLRSESFDSSDLDSLASDDLMCEGDSTFGELTDESHLHNSTMPGEQGFSPYQNMGKGKRLRNNSIEYLVASFDKRHRHHSTGQTYASYTSSPRANLRAGGLGHLVGRETIVLDASVYKQMVQELSSMKAALVKLGKMLQDPKALTEMLAATQQGQDVSMEGGRTTKDSTTQCDQIETLEEQVQTDMQALLSSQEACQMEELEGAVQSDISSPVCKQRTECIVCDESHTESNGMTKGSSVKNGGCSPKQVELAQSTLDVDEGTSFIREPFRVTSNTTPDELSHTGHVQSSGDASDDSALGRSQQQGSKSNHKHVYIPDKNVQRANINCNEILSHKVDSSPSLECRKLSSSDDSSIDSGSRLRYSRRVLGTKERAVPPNAMKEKLSSSDDGCGSSSMVPHRIRNQSDSSEESEDSLSRGEKSKLLQLRRPVSRMQRPRQMQRPKTGQYQGRKPDGQVIPAKTRMQKPTHVKGNNRPQETTHQRDQQNTLEWQQLQLQQQQDKLNKQHQAARKQQQETQQKLLTQQQKLQKEQQDMVSVNLQKQQEILVEQQHQQLKMQQLRQQCHQLKQQRSTDSSPLQSLQPKGVIMKRSSNQELTSAQHRSPVKERTTQEMRHSSPDLVEGINFLSTQTAKVQHSEKQNGCDNQMMPPRSRLPGPSCISKLPARSNGNTVSKEEGVIPTHVKNMANGIPLSKSKLQSPKFPRRAGSSVGMAKLHMQSPEQVGASCSNGNQKNPANHLQSNQNNSQSTHQTTVSTTRMTTTITTVTHPQSQSVSDLPSPIKSSKRPTSRLVQPKSKMQSKIPKGSGIPVRGKDGP
ncbi:uncharacterized protein [Diadema antillarum]|uniref:uncharacterized protein n=1 Tax=Diadema antillarum TaxID=105358 RepID=UPI003A8A9B93